MTLVMTPAQFLCTFRIRDNYRMKNRFMRSFTDYQMKNRFMRREVTRRDIKLSSLMSYIRHPCVVVVVVVSVIFIANTIIIVAVVMRREVTSS